MGIIIGISVAGGVVLALAGVLVFIFFRKRRSQHKPLNVYGGGDDLTPFITPLTFSAPYSDVPMTATSTTFSTSGSHTSGVPLLRNPHSPGRPVLAAGIPQESHQGSVHGLSETTSSDAGRIYAGVRATTSSSRSDIEEENRMSMQEGSSASASLRPLVVVNPLSPAQYPVSEKELAQRAREREVERQRAVIQHEDAEDILEVPPAYKDRA